MKKIVQAMVCIMSVAFGLHYTHLLQAKGKAITSPNKFDRVLNKNNLVVVFFYEQDKTTDKKTKKEYRQLKEQLSSLSKEYSFKRAGVYFGFVNSAQKHDGEIAKEYRIKTMPSIVLFKDGGVEKGTFGSPLMHTDPLTKTAIRDFINSHFAERIEKIKKEKTELEEERARQSAAYGPYWGWGYGYGWPYNYYGPYGYSGYPYSGFSVGVGVHHTFGGYHWHHGHSGHRGGRGGGRRR